MGDHHVCLSLLRRKRPHPHQPPVKRVHHPAISSMPES
nr:MAG TPA: hypothetical protein [Caudoviricetes sp.]